MPWESAYSQALSQHTIQSQIQFEVKIWNGRAVKAPDWHSGWCLGPIIKEETILRICGREVFQVWMKDMRRGAFKVCLCINFLRMHIVSRYVHVYIHISVWHVYMSGMYIYVHISVYIYTRISIWNLLCLRPYIYMIYNYICVWQCGWRRKGGSALRPVSECLNGSRVCQCQGRSSKQSLC